MPDEELGSRTARNAFLEALEATIEPDELNRDGDADAGPSLHDILPAELLPVILGHLRYRQNELARTCLVCKEWARVSKPLLWEWVRAPRDTERIEQAFVALSQNIELCSYVKELEVRVYPLASPTRLDELQEQALVFFQNATHLRTLTWTRKGSLTNRLLEAVVTNLTSLQHLEINGAHGGDWDPAYLLRLPQGLRSLVILLPERDIVSDILPEWLSTLAPGRAQLSKLSLINFQSSVLNTTTLMGIGKSLGCVTNLTIHHCTRMTDGAMLFALKNCGPLEHLSLESAGISDTFYADAVPYLQQLKSLRTSHPGRKMGIADGYYQGLIKLVRSCAHFSSLTHYLSGDVERGVHPQVSHDFIAALLDNCGSRLSKLEISGLSISLDDARDICFRARDLEHLVLPIDRGDIDDLQFSIIGMRRLRTLHLVAGSSTTLQLDLWRMLDIVRFCPETLRAIGAQARIRSVVRELARPSSMFDESQNDPTAPSFIKNGIKVSLRLWNEPVGIWPESLQVIRT